MVGKRYPVLVRLVALADHYWIDIEGDALWSQTPLWTYTLREWCILIERWFRRRVESDPERLTDFETEMTRPDPTLRLYAFRKKGRDAAPIYEPTFMDVMGSIHR